MGNTCTSETKIIIETKYIQPKIPETRTIETQTEDCKKFILISVVSPTEFMASDESPSSETNSAEKLLKKVKGNTIVSFNSPDNSGDIINPVHNKTLRNYTVNVFQDFDFDPNYVTE